MEKPAVEFFFSFRSPFSYLAVDRAFGLPERFNVSLVYRGIRPMVTRGVPLPVSKKLYILWDAAREAERLGIPFGKIYDPIGDGALRCLYVAEYAAEAGKQAEFVIRASRAIWAEGVCVAGDRGLKRICEELGLDWEGCKKAIADPALHERIEQNNVRLGEIGHWGVPTFLFKGEVFWGQDRISYLEEALAASGLAK